MGFRFSKSIKVGGARLNLSKSGVGASIGVKGARVGIGPRGIRTTFSLPGTGLSHSTHSAVESGPSIAAAGGCAGFVLAAGAAALLLTISPWLGGAALLFTAVGGLAWLARGRRRRDRPVDGALQDGPYREGLAPPELSATAPMPAALAILPLASLRATVEQRFLETGRSQKRTKMLVVQIRGHMAKLQLAGPQLYGAEISRFAPAVDQAEQLLKIITQALVEDHRASSIIDIEMAGGATSLPDGDAGQALDQAVNNAMRLVNEARGLEHALLQDPIVQRIAASMSGLSR